MVVKFVCVLWKLWFFLIILHQNLMNHNNFFPQKITFFEFTILRIFERGKIAVLICNEFVYAYASPAIKVINQIQQDLF